MRGIRIMISALRAVRAGRAGIGRPHRRARAEGGRADAPQSMGTRWAKIIESLPGRSDNAVKNRWYSLMRKQIRHIVRSPTPSPHAVQTPQPRHADVRAPRRSGESVAVQECRDGREGPVACAGRGRSPHSMGKNTQLKVARPSLLLMPSPLEISN